MTTITTSFSDESAASTLSSDDSSLSTEPTELTNLTGVANGVAAANQNVVPSAWRKPQSSQRRTRERLCCVLKGLGQKVGFERSPSVSGIQHINLVIANDSDKETNPGDDWRTAPLPHRYLLKRKP